MDLNTLYARSVEGSAAAGFRSFMATTLEIGEVVAWIFNNEMGGYRVK